MESRFRNRNRHLMESESKLQFNAGIGIGIGIGIECAGIVPSLINTQMDTINANDDTWSIIIPYQVIMTQVFPGCQFHKIKKVT